MKETSKFKVGQLVRARCGPHAPDRMGPQPDGTPFYNVGKPGAGSTGIVLELPRAAAKLYARGHRMRRVNHYVVYFFAERTQLAMRGWELVAPQRPNERSK